jgi:hypothetical protein
MGLWSASMWATVSLFSLEFKEHKCLENMTQSKKGKRCQGPYFNLTETKIYTLQKFAKILCFLGSSRHYGPVIGET